MKTYLTALFVCLWIGVHAAHAPSQPTDANVYGHVVDRETREHIPYAAVAVTASTFGTTTDASGHFFLKNLPPGELTIEVRALGYEPQRKTIALRRGRTVEMNFEWRRPVFRWTRWSSRPAAASVCAAKRPRW